MTLNPETLIPATIVIHTLNEQLNLPTALASCSPFFQEVLVVDSGSIDATKAIAEEAGASVLELAGDRSTLVANRNHVLRTYPFATEWVFVLDADESITPALRAEIAQVVTSETKMSGYWVCFENIFLGKWVRHSSIYPNWNLRLLKHRDLKYEDRKVNAHINVEDCNVGYLKNRFVHDDKRGIKSYLRKLSELVVLESDLRDSMTFVEVVGILNPSLSPNKRRRILKGIFQRLPGKPFLMFFYLYVWKLGFLDGRSGYYHCVFRSMVEASMDMVRYETQLRETDKTNR